MEENVNNAEEKQPEEEKIFTQDEVNEIVKKRLQREREKIDAEITDKLDEQTAAAQEDIAARETIIACKEFLIDNNYPLDLLDIIGASDVTEFQNKITQLDGLLKPRQTFPAYEPEPDISTRDSIRQAFSPDARHKPKSWY